jgi:hypothetical protein
MPGLMVSVRPVQTKGGKDMSHPLDEVKKMFVDTIPDDQQEINKMISQVDDFEIFLKISALI